MFYVLMFNRCVGEFEYLSDGGKYPVVDTEDGVIEYYTLEELCKIQDIVNIHNFSLSPVRPYTYPERLYTFLTLGEISSSYYSGSMWSETNWNFGLENNELLVKNTRLNTEGHIKQFSLVYDKKTLAELRYSGQINEFAVFVEDSPVFCAEVLQAEPEINSFFRLGNLYVFNVTILTMYTGFQGVPNVEFIRLFFTEDLKLKYIWTSHTRSTNVMPCDESIIARFNMLFPESLLR